ncbi:hypothetical protein [Methanobrevibacter sp.]|uniref:hypothetical protein n=1 Tax=Methanobrevibacter sp. TaxID=66852 RepID=UPI0026DFAA62|nr:hypothetical protein [Methanobrevibacter sp.]MDO5859880.1 hypothetical protein [Methanobrevibacter sp.]
MDYKLENGYILVSPEKDITEFIATNENTIEILNVIRPHLIKHFPNSSFSLELCDRLPWTTEEKLLVNISVSLKCFSTECLITSTTSMKRLQDILEKAFVRLCCFPICRMTITTG